MNICDPVLALTHAMTMARHRDLPDAVSTWRGQEQRSRPQRDELDVRLFMQSWPNTSAGIDAASGMAGQAFCTAPTVVVMWRGTACVYFGECLAYSVTALKGDFLDDMRRGNLASQRSAVSRYDAHLP